MANYVNFTVNFDQINEAATAKLKELYARIRNEEGSQAWFSDMFVEGDLTYEDTGKYEWTTANIGPKWCYLEEFDETFMNGTSAWCYPEEGITKLLEILEEFDPNIITSVTYEDENTIILKAIEQAKDGTWQGNVDKNGNVIVHIKGKAFTVTSNNPASIEKD